MSARADSMRLDTGPGQDGDRIGHTIEAWGDRPFWWIGPSGKDSVLVMRVAVAKGEINRLDYIVENNVLRVVPHSNLAILDPIWTTAYMSRNHGYMIYDTLFGTDEHAKIKPQMVETWTESPDKRMWTFKLRKGLEFHDGKAVTGEDVIASLKRWAARDAMGSALMQFVSKMDSPAPDTFRIFLGEACGFVLEALGKPSSNVPLIMPKRIAETDAFKQIEEHIGSGPYVFRKDEFKPGDKAVYVKFAKYVPRKEPPSGTAGGKQVYVDRVEWNLALRDAQAQVNALQKGEVDIIEALGFDHFETVKADTTLQMPKYANLGLQYMARFNHLHKPFDNAKVRRAAIAAHRSGPIPAGSPVVTASVGTATGRFTCGIRRRPRRAGDAARFPFLRPRATRATAARTCCARCPRTRRRCGARGAARCASRTACGTAR